MADSSIRVYNKDVLDQLLGTGPTNTGELSFDRNKTQFQDTGKTVRTPNETANKTLGGSQTQSVGRKSPDEEDRSRPASQATTFAEEHKAAKKAQREKLHKEMQDQTQRETERRIADRAARREAAFNEMYSQVVEGMDNPDGVLHEVDTMLATAEASKLKKNEALYKEWKESVYDPIQDQLTTQVNALDSKTVMAKNIANLDTYLNVTNHKKTHNGKATVFRDSILPDEYLPSNNHTIVVNTKGMFDPLKRDLIKTHTEKVQQGLDVPDYGHYPGKITLNVAGWHKVEATPHGHFTDAAGELKPVTLTDASAKRAHSEVNMDQYNVARGKAVMNAEMPKTKLIVDDQGHRAQRADFHGVINQRDWPQGTTGGDNWLEARGKRTMEAPCDPNRQDGLYPQLNYASDHALPGGHGDRWLSAKGKRTGINPQPPPGSRKDLFVVVSQSEGKLNPEEASGDRWIEARGKTTYLNHNDYEKKPPGETKMYLSLQDNDGVPIVHENRP
mmetsp:Transcript_23861/g.28839  ORF Transcript_23861/g.28839 Transcript_23861/m.28839 type:complete len:502 (+) Transcript_23861:85-1590(+)